MADAVQVQRGQTLSLAVTFFEAEMGGTRLSLVGATVRIREASSALLTEFTLTVTDAAQGQCSVTATEEQTEGLRDGRTNWFRLEAEFPDANIVTPKIWVTVK